jgi:4'-phosphopantetheinyl transferase
MNGSSPGTTLGRLRWIPVAAPPPLEGGDLHLWKIDCGPGVRDLEEQWAILSDHERSRAERLLQPRHRERYVHAHAGLRRLLSHYVGLSAPLLGFELGKSGKPLLAGAGNGIEFNLTTSDDLAMVAVSRNQPVGVDCERIRPRTDLLAIAFRMFDRDEARAVAAAPERERLARFYVAWTAMEANVKADGRGLSRRLEQPATGTLEIAHCTPADGFVAAVARTSVPPPSQWKTLCLEEN